MSDTDCMYIALGAETMRECVPPHRRKAFDRAAADFLVTNKHDVSCAGRFIEEAQGRRLYAISPKLHILLDGNGKVGDLAMCIAQVR